MVQYYGDKRCNSTVTIIIASVIVVHVFTNLEPQTSSGKGVMLNDKTIKILKALSKAPLVVPVGDVSLSSASVSSVTLPPSKRIQVPPPFLTAYTVSTPKCLKLVTQQVVMQKKERNRKYVEKTFIW